METKTLVEIVNKLRKEEWNILEYEIPVKLQLNYQFKERYKIIPRDYLYFLSHIKSAVNKDEQSWFLCQNEYNDTSEDSFLWNQLEIMSLDTARDDDDIEWVNEIKLFWDCHLPIMLSIRSGYSYVAIGTCEENLGKIFYGVEPEFEETTLIANSFIDFLNKLTTSYMEYPYSDFI